MTLLDVQRIKKSTKPAQGARVEALKDIHSLWKANTSLSWKSGSQEIHPSQHPSHAGQPTEGRVYLQWHQHLDHQEQDRQFSSGKAGFVTKTSTCQILSVEGQYPPALGPLS